MRNKSTRRTHGVSMMNRRKRERSFIPMPFTFLFVEWPPGYSSIHCINQATHIMRAIDRRSAILSGSKDLAEKTLKKSGVRISAKSQPTSSTALQAIASLVRMGLRSLCEKAQWLFLEPRDCSPQSFFERHKRFKTQ